MADTLVRGLDKPAADLARKAQQAVADAADGAAKGVDARAGKIGADTLKISRQAAAALESAPPVAKIAAPQGYTVLNVANHLHVVNCSPDADGTPQALLGLLKKAGVDGFIQTDHNSMVLEQTPEWQTMTQDLIGVKGMESGALAETGQTVHGHVGVIGIQGYENIPTNASLDEIIQIAKARGAKVIIANHPYLDGNAWETRSADPAAGGGLQPEVNAIEVWNGMWGWTEPISHNSKALVWWDSILKTGRHVTAVGGSDYHGPAELSHLRLPGSEPTKPLLQVFADSANPQGIEDAIVAGHVSVRASETAPQVLLQADPKGDGSWSAIEGDSVNVPQIGTVPMRLHVTGGQGQIVEFHTKSGIEGTYPILSNDAYVPYSAVAVPKNQDYVWALVKPHTGGGGPIGGITDPITALTNPIYVNN